jgi:hypothetical protein
MGKIRAKTCFFLIASVKIASNLPLGQNTPLSRDRSLAPIPSEPPTSGSDQGWRRGGTIPCNSIPIVRQCDIWIQRDIAALDDWKPEIVPGGFAGHCVNNADQRYTYQSISAGSLHRANLRKDGRYRTTNHERVIRGRHQFHDYNF